jgi:branched-chain amino acid transport system ATP-binding protein
MTAARLRVEGLTMRFGGLTAVNDVSFTAERSEITALIGPNGAGKTTMFNCITGFYKPSAGRIALALSEEAAGEEGEALLHGIARRAKQRGLFRLESMPEYRVAREARIARTFQNIRLFGGMTVLENLLVAQHNALSQELLLLRYAAAERAAVDKARYWLDLAGLLARGNDCAATLSYGAQRRLEIARAMCTVPALLCLDEPAAGLNPRESAELTTLILTIREKHGVSVLLIEHDMSVVMSLADHVVVLDYGVKIADGTAAEIRNDKNVIAAYLGVEQAEVKAASAPQSVGP